MYAQSVFLILQNVHYMSVTRLNIIMRKTFLTIFITFIIQVYLFSLRFRYILINNYYNAMATEQSTKLRRLLLFLSSLRYKLI